MFSPEEETLRGGGPYHKIWLALQEDNELSAIFRSRQLHIYRNGKKVLILAGKALCMPATEESLPCHLSGFRYGHKRFAKGKAWIWRREYHL